MANPTGKNQYSGKGSRVGSLGKNAYVWHGSNQKRLAGKTSLTPQRGDPVYATSAGQHGIARDYNKSAANGARGVMVKVARSSFSKENRTDVARGDRNFHASKVPVKMIAKVAMLKAR